MIRAIVAERASYGYRRVTALLNRQFEAQGRARVDHKRICRIMRLRHLLLPRYSIGDDYDYSRARDEMLVATDSSYAPWYIVNADDKRRARLSCISHLLSLIPYQKIEREKVKLPVRQKPHGYTEPKNRRYNFVPELF